MKNALGSKQTRKRPVEAVEVFPAKPNLAADNPLADLQIFLVQEVAATCRTCAETIRRHIRAGRLKAVRIGKGYGVRRRDLEAYVEGGAA